VRIVLGFPPGAGFDATARALADLLRGRYAATVIVENKPGAGGRFAVEAVKAAAPDGTTMLFTPAGPMVLYPHVYKRLGYDPLADFLPVSATHSIQMGCTVGASVPATTWKEYLDWAKKDPLNASYGTGGAGTMPHFIGMLLARQSGVELNHVPYRGGGPLLTDLIGGQLPAACAPIGQTLIPPHRSGQIRILGVADGQRMKSLPEVPTYTELGYKELDLDEWMGIFLPAKTPRPIVEALNGALRAAMANAAMVPVLELYQSEAQTSTAADFTARVKHDLEHWRKIVKQTGFVPEE
jgi:tripartite-type tricarboxylate transporter receptor subunit TctC